MNIKILILFLLFVFYNTSNSFSQLSDIKIETKQEDDNSITFNYAKEKLGTFKISLNFDFINNAFISDYEGVIKLNSGTLFKLKPKTIGNSIGFKYNFSYIRGNPFTLIDSSFVYLLPFLNNISVYVSNMNYLGEQYFHNIKPKNWKAFHFSFDSTTIVTACRKGQVIELVNKYETKADENTIYTSMQNYLTIEHEDGSLATYKGFKKDGFLVNEGDEVFPNSKLGLIEKMYNKDNYGLSVMFYFLNDKEYKKAKENLNNQTIFNQKHSYEFYDPLFSTDSGIIRLQQNKKYAPINTESIILKEMSKRELKKYKQLSSN